MEFALSLHFSEGETLRKQIEARMDHLAETGRAPEVEY
jgi:hypothetical protein